MGVAPRQAKIPKAVRWAVYKRDGYVCQKCGSDQDLTLDHIQRICEGGGDEPENLRTLCRSCNVKRTRKSGGAVIYDPRRPRLPVELAARVDASRGQVPFNRWVVEALEKVLGRGLSTGEAAADESVPVPPRASGSPRSEPFVCPVASCQWPGAKRESEGPCPIHRRNLIARRS